MTVKLSKSCALILKLKSNDEADLRRKTRRECLKKGAYDRSSTVLLSRLNKYEPENRNDGENENNVQKYLPFPLFLLRYLYYFRVPIRKPVWRNLWTVHRTIESRPRYRYGRYYYRRPDLHSDGIPENVRQNYSRVILLNKTQTTIKLTNFWK